MGTLLVASMVQTVLGTALVAIGRWGIRVARAVPVGLLSEEEWARRTRAYSRGGWVSIVVGALILVFAMCTGLAVLSGATPVSTSTLRPLPGVVGS